MNDWRDTHMDMWRYKLFWEKIARLVSSHNWGSQPRVVNSVIINFRSISNCCCMLYDHLYLRESQNENRNIKKGPLTILYKWQQLVNYHNLNFTSCPSKIFPYKMFRASKRFLCTVQLIDSGARARLTQNIRRVSFDNLRAINALSPLFIQLQIIHGKLSIPIVIGPLLV